MAFKPVQVQDLKLTGSGISSGASSITVQQLVKPGTSTTVTMTDFGSIGYGVIEPGTPREENFSFTGVTQNANGTATFTGCTVGLDFVSPYSSTAALKYNHAGNSIVRISNTSAYYSEFAKLENDQTFEGINTFPASGGANAPRTSSTAVAPALDAEYATKKYVDDTAIAGSPDATTEIKGIVEIATQAEVDAGTSTGGTGASVVVRPPELANVIQDGSYIYAADSVGTDSYAITLTPAITAYVTGQMFNFKAGTANTGACTLNVNGLGVKDIKKNTDQALETGDIEVDSIVTVVYDGTNFQMQNQQASMLSTSNMTTLTSYISGGSFPSSSQALTSLTATRDIKTGDQVYSSATGQAECVHGTLNYSNGVENETNVSQTAAGGTSGIFDAIPVNTNKNVIVYHTGTNNTSIKACSFVATTNTFSLGATVSPGTYCGIDYISTDKFISGYNTGGSTEVRVNTISTVTITQQTAAVIEASTAGFVKVAMYDTGNGVVIFTDDSPNTTMRAKLFTVSGNTTTSGNGASLAIGSAFVPMCMKKIDSTHALCVYRVGTTLYGVMISTDGSNPTFGTPVSFSATVNTSCYFADIKQIDGTKWVVTADDAYIITVNVAGNTFTESSTVSINTSSTGAAILVQNTRYFLVTDFTASGNGTKYYLYYRNSSTDALSLIESGTVVGTTNAGVNPGQYFHSIPLDFSPARLTLLYSEVDGSNNGDDNIATVDFDTDYYNLFIGMSNSDASASASTNITIDGSFASASGVVGNKQYYANYGNPWANSSYGTFTNTEDTTLLTKIGVGIDTDTLVIQ